MIMACSYRIEWKRVDLIQPQTQLYKITQFNQMLSDSSETQDNTEQNWLTVLLLIKSHFSSALLS